MNQRLTTLGALLLAANATGAAWAANSQPNMEHCDREMGSLAVAEPQDYILSRLSYYKLGSPTAMLRMIAQESGCFAVVERGAAMQNLQQERALAAGGQLQAGSNIGGGQMQVADFVMTPAVQFSEDSGGVGGSVTVGSLGNSRPNVSVSASRTMVPTGMRSTMSSAPLP